MDFVEAERVEDPKLPSDWTITSFDGTVERNDPEVEGRNVQTLLDWVATQPEAPDRRRGQPPGGHGRCLLRRRHPAHRGGDRLPGRRPGPHHCLELDRTVAPSQQDGEDRLGRDPADRRSRPGPTVAWLRRYLDEDTSVELGPAAEAVEVPIDVGGIEGPALGAPQLTITYSGTTPPGAFPTRIFAQLVDEDLGAATIDLETISQRVGGGRALTLQLAATEGLTEA